MNFRIIYLILKYCRHPFKIYTFCNREQQTINLVFNLHCTYGDLNVKQQEFPYVRKIRFICLGIYFLSHSLNQIKSAKIVFTNVIIIV